jgi:hypothetical protein
MTVSWTAGPAEQPIKLIGHIVSVNCDTAQIRSRGKLFQVELTRLKRAPNARKPRQQCLYCGGLCKDSHSKYCSKAHFDIDRAHQTDKAVFAAIIAYKAANDGTSPCEADIARLAYVARTTVVRSLARLEASGKIWCKSTQTRRQIGVVGGKWTYRED